MRLIDADALLPLMKYATTDNEIGVFPIKIGFNAIAKVINEAPTVDAVPVRHGKWLRWRDLNGIKRCKCSECIVSYGNMDTPYCPNCGAKMDGEDDDETD